MIINSYGNLLLVLAPLQKKMDLAYEVSSYHENILLTYLFGLENMMINSYENLLLATSSKKSDLTSEVSSYR